MNLAAILTWLGTTIRKRPVSNGHWFHAQLLFNQHVISSTPGAGTEVWGSATNMVRRLVAGTGVTLSLGASGNVVLDSTVYRQ